MNAWDGWSHPHFQGLFRFQQRLDMFDAGFYPDLTAKSRELPNNMARRFYRERGGKRQHLVFWRDRDGDHWRAESGLWQSATLSTWEAAMVLGELAEWGGDVPVDTWRSIAQRFKALHNG